MRRVLRVGFETRYRTAVLVWRPEPVFQQCDKNRGVKDDALTPQRFNAYSCAPGRCLRVTQRRRITGRSTYKAAR